MTARGRWLERRELPRVLTIREAAIRYRVHEETLRGWCRKGVIRHVRVGPGSGLIRVIEDDLARTVTPGDIHDGPR